jgi:hypothetical protein
MRRHARRQASWAGSKRAAARCACALPMHATCGAPRHEQLTRTRAHLVEERLVAAGGAARRDVVVASVRGDDGEAQVRHIVGRRARAVVLRVQAEPIRAPVRQALGQLEYRLPKGRSAQRGAREGAAASARRVRERARAALTPASAASAQRRAGARRRALRSAWPLRRGPRSMRCSASARAAPLPRHPRAPRAPRYTARTMRAQQAAARRPAPSQLPGRQKGRSLHAPGEALLRGDAARGDAEDGHDATHGGDACARAQRRRGADALRSCLFESCRSSNSGGCKVPITSRAIMNSLFGDLPAPSAAPAATAPPPCAAPVPALDEQQPPKRARTEPPAGALCATPARLHARPETPPAQTRRSRRAAARAALRRATTLAARWSASPRTWATPRSFARWPAWPRSCSPPASSRARTARQPSRRVHVSAPGLPSAHLLRLRC